MDAFTEHESKQDANFIENLKRLRIRFCRENVIVLTKLRIPLYVCFIASLGSKFNYYGPDGKQDDMFKYLIIFEMLRDKVEDFMSMLVVKRNQKMFEKKFVANNFRNRTCAPTSAQKFIKLQMKRVKVFLNKNPGVKIFPADKGGRIVIADLETYRSKMRLYLQINTKTRVYFHYKELSVEYIKELCESKYERIRTIVNVFLEQDRLIGFKNSCHSLIAEPFVISRIYGLFKIHKEDYPVRPIVSATNCLGAPLAKWIRLKLTIIAKQVGKHQVRSSRDLFQKLEGRKLNEANHVLVTFDFDNMFTNIPFQTTKDIIRMFYYLIEEETTMPVDVFLESLTFLVEECAFFTFEGEIYLQAEGLAMGNSLSQILAEITTSYLLNEALKQFDGGQVSFIFKYVDDLIGGIDERYLVEVRNAIESAHGGMKLKMVIEDENNEVDYLQMRIGRNVRSDNSLHIRWVQKEFSAKRILDYHSFHPFRMKVNVVKEFIRNAFNMSSKEHWNMSMNLLRKTLANSNYPYYFVYDLISTVKKELCNYSNSNVKTNNNVVKRFIPCPYRPGPMNFIRKAIRRSNLGMISLTPQMVDNNDRLVFTNLKDRRTLNCMVNSSFVVRCQDCEFSKVLVAGRRDVESTFRLSLGDVNSDIQKHCRDYNHVMNEHIARKDIKQYRNKTDLAYNDEFIQELRGGLQSSDTGSHHVAKLVINALGNVMRTQSLCVFNECRIIILKRSMERNTILKRDVDINNMILKLLSDPFCDREGVLKFQHQLYDKMMSFEINNLEKEMIHLKLLASKQRRVLKSISPDKIFDMCNDLLKSRRASEMIDYSRENEIIWKAAIADKQKQRESIEKWLGLVSNISNECKYGSHTINVDLSIVNNLATSRTESADKDLLSGVGPKYF